MTLQFRPLNFFKVSFCWFHLLDLMKVRSQILSFPSTGTTWMQEIVTLIFSKGDPHLSQTVPNWARAPWLEQHYCTALLETLTTKPRVITTHLPYHLLGPALQGSKAKVKLTLCFYVSVRLPYPYQIVFNSQISVYVSAPKNSLATQSTVQTHCCCVSSHRSSM